ncbi:TonB-dependent receptor [Acinetobacter sp. NIPH 2699]|uniref:TonB-dependent receptor plug domain-containing protein n=1 Tax=Acinetobacter sp. NIPH 2699 TaxID=2923433 RepID=UPI001F4A6DD7|nr:TonB-dependent receptor [Acinetobacter sp. NIPH 2699]MCH7336659.1 TonB-dependent receptor [Acinetobacter sp. NIPH 2699]
MGKLVFRPHNLHGYAAILCIGLIAPKWAFAADVALKSEQDAFQLGVIRIMAEQNQFDQVASKIDDQKMQQFQRSNIGDALNLLSGITTSNNARNEQMIYVRGFDARQVPLFIDGIPVYVPYDGYVDFNRFTTADLAEIQVAKGFSSIKYGANTLGGAINLVTRKPQRELEGDVRLGFGEGQERQAGINLGTNQGVWYLQTAASYLQRDGFKLSSDFQPTATEDGGLRNNSQNKDTKYSIKLGITPNTTDEYAFSYIKQEGEKGNPPTTGTTAIRYWKWPYWDKESLYFNSSTTLTSHESLKIRAYHDRYDNELNSYSDDRYEQLKTSGQGSVSTGRSIYHDRVNGASIVLESDRLAGHQLSVIGHYKTDEHRELDATKIQNTHFEDKIWSLGLEDNIQLFAQTFLSLGVSQHRLEPKKVLSIGNPYSLPNQQSATDAQMGVFYDGFADAQLYATIARKTRLPSLKDRYSQRLGTFIENPELQAEKAMNYEVGYKADLSHDLRVEAALFYSDIKDKIQSVANVDGNKSQMQNIGQVHIAGTEFDLQYQPTSWFAYGGNYTYLKLKNETDANAKITDIPKHKLSSYVVLSPIENVKLQAGLEQNSSRWVSNTLKLSGYQIANLQLSYEQKNTTGQWRFATGINNLTDKNYALADGFPSAGRMWFANTSWSF